MFRARDRDIAQSRRVKLRFVLFLLLVDAGAGKKIQRQPQIFQRGIGFMGRAQSKVSRIRAPGRRHLDVGSSCTALVPFL